MSTLQPRIHSPSSRQPYSPKVASPNCLSPPNSGHHSKKSQKQTHKSPKSGKKEKRSPNKTSSFKSHYDTKATDANSPLRNQGQHATTTGRKNQQKTKNNSENALPFDNRLDNKARQFDHHILYPHHDMKIPYKQKSHSVKNVSIPPELLVSPKLYDPNLVAALIHKKPHTTKHSNFNEAELEQADYNDMDLLAMYNRHEESQQLEVKTNKGNSKFFSSTKQKKDNKNGISKRKVNTPETSPPSRVYNEGTTKKFKNKISPRAYEILVGSPARSHHSQSNQQQQKTQKVAKHGNFMQGPLPGIEEQFEENIKGYSVKSAEIRVRTGSMPNETHEVIYEDTEGYSRSPARPKTTKNSEPNLYNDHNFYNKRASESQVQVQQVMQGGKEKFVSSTRSAFEPTYGQRDEKDPFMNDILKHNALRELKVNPNAKFLLLREQVRERRNRTGSGFKSADWNATEEITKLASQHQTSPTKNYNISPPISPILCQSPNVMKSVDVSTSPIRDSRSVEKENKIQQNDQLVQLFNKTKNILASYKNKEQDWDKERKMFISEIKRLRGLLKETVN